MKNNLLIALRGKRTQAEIARLISVGRSSYANWEQGVRNLSVANAKKLARLHNVQWNIFFADE